jgi:transcription initiation factor TFIID subunit 7
MGGLKLKINTASSRDPSISTPVVATPGGIPQTPGVTPGGTAKRKIVFKSSKPATPAPVPIAQAEEAKPKKTKAGRATKPSAKLVESRKRVKDETDTEEDGSTINVQPRPAKRLKILNPKTPNTPVAHTPVLKVKHKGKIPKRPYGDGYDSEASDREEDPAIEEEFVLRMLPGPDCEYLRQAIAEKKIGNGADVQLKFLDGLARRAAVIIKGNIYAATLVDLPCIIEGMKSWDKRGWWKSADICQMLWVFASVKREKDVETIAFPKIIDPTTHQFPHGLTPPLHYARKRRFRNRISRTAIEAVEDAVEQLLAEDLKASETRLEMINPDQPETSSGSEEYDGEEDAEGEVDEPEPAAYSEPTTYFNGVHHPSAISQTPIETEDEGLDFLDDMVKEFEGDLATTTPSLSAAVDTPAPNPSSVSDSGDDSFDGDEEDEDEVGAVEVDENERARLAEIQGMKEDIAELEVKIADMQRQLASQVNPILKKRLEDNIRKLKAELQVKKSSIGEGDDG